ncbi:MAG: ParA family protein [Armatimonadetes bacterium]|nr:ParA family protein [Armatimonadota bacterium]
MLDEVSIEQTLLRVGPPPNYLWLAPSNLDLADIWRRVAGRVGLESLLKTALTPLLARFKYIIMDCPPSLDLTTINCLVAASEVIVPVDMSIFSVRGMIKLQATMQEVRKVNPDLPPPKILACRTEHTTVSVSIEAGLRERLGNNIFSVAIPKTKDVQASQFSKQPLPLHSPRSKATQAYQSVIEEIRRG